MRHEDTTNFPQSIPYEHPQALAYVGLHFADLHDRYYGSKVIYSIAMASGIPTILSFSFPLINALARTQRPSNLDGLVRGQIATYSLDGAVYGLL